MVHSEKTKKILRGLEKGYDKVAHIFPEKNRYFRWEDFGFLLKEIDEKSRILDFGCGNGYFSNFFKDRYFQYHGVDIANKLIGSAKKKYAAKNNFFKKISPYGRLPYENSLFDLALSVGVFHHFPSPEYSLNRALELNRVLKKNSLLAVSVFNFWRPRSWKIILGENLKKIREGRLPKIKEYSIPYQAALNSPSPVIFYRYFNAFTPKELRDLFAAAGFAHVKTIKARNDLIFLGRKKAEWNK